MIGILLIALVVVVGYKLSPLLLPRADVVIQPDPACNLQRQTCAVTLPSGYWMWSDQQNDFIWVSGVWRDIPPGRRWVPGNWTALGGGDFPWVPGFWAGEQVQEVGVGEFAGG